MPSWGPCLPHLPSCTAYRQTDSVQVPVLLVTNTVTHSDAGDSVTHCELEMKMHRRSPVSKQGHGEGWGQCGSCSSSSGGSRRSWLLRSPQVPSVLLPRARCRNKGMRTRLGCLSHKSDSCSDFTAILPDKPNRALKAGSDTCWVLSLHPAHSLSDNVLRCPVITVIRSSREELHSSGKFGATRTVLASLTGCLGHVMDGVAAFRAFLKTEFSEENLEFWLACEEFKKTRSTAKLVSKAHRIFEEFVDVQAPREVNIDFQTREATRKNMQEPSLTCFDQAQGKVHSLMEKDSYPRFLRSKMYLDLLSQSQRRLS
ncbi:Regulator of G-protein signaling 8 [Tupaia chinensis]|uniref:Regulator of G-protein signaling 8 n=1 Tax=Tupaia chinensis TaxID=246437 RepID=L9LAX4_TUPCH|nr:Regulator of G-protein signaling 8 [Tupaia chinensis]